MSVMYVDEALHIAGIAALRAAASAKPSLVDYVSFAYMRDREISRAFAFDRDFRREGFQVVPG